MKLFEICNKIEDELKSKKLATDICSSSFNPFNNSKNIEFEYGVKDESKIMETVENILSGVNSLHHSTLNHTEYFKIMSRNVINTDNYHSDTPFYT